MQFVERRILGRKVQSSAEVLDPRTLDLHSFPPIESIFKRRDSERRKQRALSGSDTFDITAVGNGGDAALIPLSEIAADELVTYRGIVIVSANNRIIYGHEIVRKALSSGEAFLAVHRIVNELSPTEEFALAVRYAAKEGRLSHMARIECIVTLRDEHAILFTDIQFLLTPPRAKDSATSLTEIRKEYVVGKWYQKYAGIKLSILGDEISEDAFSRLKMMAGNSKMLADARSSEATEAHFVRSAVFATIQGLPRFEDNMRKVVADNDIYPRFAEGQLSLSQAITEVKAKHPEESHDSHPHYEFVGATKKIENTEMRKQLAAAASKGPSRTEKQFEELLLSWIGISSSLKRRTLISLCQADPHLYLDIGISERSDLLEEVLQARAKAITRLTSLGNRKRS